MILVVFTIIYFIVSTSVNFHINQDLQIEIERHQNEVKYHGNSLHLVEDGEWEEREHREINVNPIFVQVLDNQAKFIDKSPNLYDQFLHFNFHQQEGFHDTKIGDIDIRQVQAPLVIKDKIVGYVIIAMSLEEPKMVLKNLQITLSILFPIIMIALFFVTRWIAGRSIKPALNIIQTTSNITNNNFDQRITLPENKDELFMLSSSINELLDRIESAIVREKQFTSDASHELRTPLAVIKGTLEVLIRKPRENHEYIEKIKYSIKEVDRLNNLVDQLLLLARFENQKLVIRKEKVALDEMILQSLERFSSKIENKKVVVNFTFDKHFWAATDPYFASIIIENLLSNAIKYSEEGGVLDIVLSEEEDKIFCKIKDYGIGIAKEDLDKIYKQFYRSKATVHPAIKGSGLGLSITKKLCSLLQINLCIESIEGEGAEASLVFERYIEEQNIEQEIVV